MPNKKQPEGVPVRIEDQRDLHGEGVPVRLAPSDVTEASSVPKSGQKAATKKES